MTAIHTENESNIASLLTEAKIIYLNLDPYVEGELEAFDSIIDSALNLIHNRRLHRENTPNGIPPLGDTKEIAAAELEVAALHDGQDASDENDWTIDDAIMLGDDSDDE